MVCETHDADNEAEHEADVESDENEEPHLTHCEDERVLSAHLGKRHEHVVSVDQAKHCLHCQRECLELDKANFLHHQRAAVYSKKSK